jgi:nucleotide-binding universal stress UspA family protein
MPAYVEVELPVEVVQARDRIAFEAADKVKTTVEAAARAAGIEADWIAVRGDMPDAVLPYARRVDLTVIGQSGEDSPEERMARGLPEALLLASGRPILVVPRYGKFERVGERVLVAWIGTRESARAVNDAIPLLAGAHEVTVLAVNPSLGAGNDVPSGDIALHLARHDIKATASATRGEGLSVGDVLLSRAADLGVDLIVMGGYGHSRVRELALGGVTRHLLEHMTVPVLMSH